MKRRISTAKRIVAVALAATVAVSLTGCKKRKNNCGCHLQGGLNACSRLRRMATITHT